MTARTAKKTEGLVTANAMSVAGSSVARDVVSEAQPVSPTKSAAVQSQIAAGEAFMALYQQTFNALAK